MLRFSLILLFFKIKLMKTCWLLAFVLLLRAKSKVKHKNIAVRRERQEPRGYRAGQGRGREGGRSEDEEIQIGRYPSQGKVIEWFFHKGRVGREAGLFLSDLRFPAPEQHVPSVGQRRGEEINVASLLQFEAFAEPGYGIRKVADGQIGLSEAV